MSAYNHREVELKWQKRWAENNAYDTPDTKEGAGNYYFLTEFPYPSGNLHVGHWYAFSIPDIFARYMRMRGYNVLYPIGFDAFGLPAENAAIQRGLNPRVWTEENMAHMREQLRSMGATFDWSREVITNDPKYYKWTQWIFTKFFEKGLAYQAEREVNWCPKDKTVLANEQVSEGKCERCGSVVEKRNMLQWNLKITDYADRLIDDLEKLEWPLQIKDAQRNWIGRSEGAEIEFELVGSDKKIKVFTTRPDTIFGATYMVLAPELALVQEFKERLENWSEVEKYIQTSRTKSEIERTAEGKEKTGVELKGIKAINPATNEHIPVWIADYVLAGYGTGAIMAVPAHDERDFQFAGVYNLPVQMVVVKSIEKTPMLHTLPYLDSGYLVNSGEFSHIKSEEAKEKLAVKFGTKKTTYRLRDWVISRQRYWGVPIPIIHCAKCGVVAVPEKDLPVLLPEIEDYLPEGSGKSPLAKVPEFVNAPCPKCGSEAQRETDTFDTFVDSSWYFLRYTDPNNSEEFASQNKMKNWMPVDLYSGGSEHTTMHLLYSRFWHKAMFDLGLVAESEPYLRRMNRGLIMGPDGQKMSKSRGNVIDPDSVVKELGSDAVRMYLAFIGPFNELGSYPWTPSGAVGVKRFLDRVLNLADKTGDASMDRETEVLLNQTIQKVNESISSLKMNTGVSALMIFSNHLGTLKKIPHEAFKPFLKLLSPFAPHIAHELSELLHYSNGMLGAWPEINASKLMHDFITVVVQINGKVRANIEVSAEISKDELEQKAKETVEDKLAGKTVAKSIVVPKKLVNFVVAE